MKNPAVHPIQGLVPIALATAYLVPLGLVIWLVNAFGANVPFWDQWGLVEFFVKLQANQVTFQDFFAQHNEHRILFPRMIIAILAFASHWNTKLEMYTSVGLVAASFGLIYAIARQSKSPLLLFQGSSLLCCAFIFSLDQQENWLWGFQVAWFLINFCVVGAISCIVLFQQRALTTRLLLAGLACLIASFSSAHGLFSWLSLLPLVVVLPGTRRAQIVRGGTWIAAFFTVVAIYQIGYVKPSHHPDLLFLVKEPQVALTYLLTLFGFLVKKISFLRSCVGAFLLLNFLFFNAYFLKKFRLSIAQDMAPWIALGWFPLLFSIVTTLGRAGFGVEQAAASRYVTVMVLLLIALIQLWRIFIQEHHEQRYRFLSGVFCAGILVALLIFNTANVINKTSFAPRAAGKACLDLVYFLDDASVPPVASCLSLLYPEPDTVIQKARLLEHLNFRNFPKSDTVTFISKPDPIAGYIDAPASKSPLVLEPTQRVLTTSGWAAFLNQLDAPDIVLFSYDQIRSFFGYALPLLDRPDVASTFKSERFVKSGWQTELHVEALPFGQHTIKAWIYDPKMSQLLQLDGEFVVIRK